MSFHRYFCTAGTTSPLQCSAGCVMFVLVYKIFTVLLTSIVLYFFQSNPDILEAHCTIRYQLAMDCAMVCLCEMGIFAYIHFRIYSIHVFVGYFCVSFVSWILLPVWFYYVNTVDMHSWVYLMLVCWMCARRVSYYMLCHCF